MMKYAATRFEPDGLYAETFKADNWQQAEAICKKNGWRLDGDNCRTINVHSNEEADEVIDALNERDISLSH